MIGSVIGGKYRIERQLGEGGMGAVYEAVHTGTGRHVALKVINSVDVAGAEAIARFEQEARTTGNIDTQHIVQVLDTGRDPSPYMVMELMVGEDLSQIGTRVGPLDPELVLRIGAQACLGLQKAHDAGVVHRDIKPANLFLAKKDLGEQIVKVLDFGIAKVRKDPMGAANAGLTRTGSMLGSPLYMSPEQARGGKQIDHRTDIWSLGLVMYEALCGSAPWADLETLGELILSICSQPPPSIQNKAPWVPPHVAQLVHGALQLQPDLRYGSATEMFNAIRAYLPNGWSIHESMVRGLPPEQRQFSAPRVDFSDSHPSLPGVPRPLMDSSPGVRSGSNTGVGSQPGVAHTHVLGQSSSTIGSVSTTHNTGPQKGGAVAALAVGGAIVFLGVVGAGGYLALKSRNAGTVPSASATHAEIPAPPPSASTEVQPKASADAVVKAVRVRIEPPTADVKVDGNKVDPEAGSVEVKGALGSVHTVTLVDGPRDTSVQIVVTESGAMPGQVVLPKAGSAHTTGKVDPKASSAGTATGKPASVPGAPGTAGLPGTGIKKGTEEFQ